MRAHQLELSFPKKGLLEEICDIQNLRESFKAVKRNKGSPGIDEISIEMYEENIDQELEQLRQAVLNWTYKPTPVKRVEIPKPNGKGVRLLGIPIIKDRVLQMAIKRKLEPLFDPTFSKHSYGFRPGRSQRDAVKAAQDIMRSGKEQVVDIDLSKFFDRINHDRLIHRLKSKIVDRRVLRLIGMILRSGIMFNLTVTIPTEGSVQGSPLSPLLSNVVLDELDKELERRGLEFCRFADDCNIFVKTERAGRRVMDSIKKFIEKKLKLKVNEEKSQVAKSDRVKFLGMTIVNGLIAISKTALNKAMEQVKDLIPRNTNVRLEQTINDFNRWYKGWAEYFAMTQYPSQLKAIEAHARRRLRARFVRQKKRIRTLYRSLVNRKVPKKLAKITACSRNKGIWHLSHYRGIEMAYPNRWFHEQLGLHIRSDKEEDHWLPLRDWVKLI